jgi:hypothetical protein
LLVVNTQALAGLKDSWRVPDDLLRRADVVVDREGIHRKRSAGTASPATLLTYRQLRGFL